MGIRADIQNDLKDAYDTDLSDIVVSFTVNKFISSGISNVEDDNFICETDSITSRGIFETVSDKKVDGSKILSTDEMLTINGLEISILLEVDDEIVLSSGTIYKVIEPNPVMGGETSPIIYEAIVRKNG